jgi:hypothetical protein
MILSAFFGDPKRMIVFPQASTVLNMKGIFFEMSGNVDCNAGSFPRKTESSRLGTQNFTIVGVPADKEACT